MSALITFDATKEFLADLLKELGHGRTELQDFQSGWVWEDDYILSLRTSFAKSIRFRQRSFPLSFSNISRPLFA